MGIVQILEAMQSQLKSDLPEVVAKLREIERARKEPSIDHPGPEIVLHNLGPSDSARTTPPDLSDVHVKLDSLLNLHQAIVDLNSRAMITTSPSVQADRELRSAQALEFSAKVARIHQHFYWQSLILNQKLNNLLNLAQSQEAQRAIQNEQQADSSRYLNELNAVRHIHFVRFRV